MGVAPSQSTACIRANQSVETANSPQQLISLMNLSHAGILSIWQLTGLSLHLSNLHLRTQETSDNTNRSTNISYNELNYQILIWVAVTPPFLKENFPPEVFIHSSSKWGYNETLAQPILQV